MKHVLLSCCLLVCILYGCAPKSVKRSVEPSAPVTETPVKLHKLQKLSITGDFNGDGLQDTLFQHNYSHLMHAEIDSSADPFQQPWDTVVRWFYEQESDVYLALGGSPDTLHLGTAQGLYCLINIGDNNADGRDEVALVIDYLDFSWSNSCRIYSLCKDGWVLLKQFHIHEDAFNYTGKPPPIFGEIRDYLEKQDGEWKFIDYLNEDYESQEDVGKFHPLEPGRCDCLNDR